MFFSEWQGFRWHSQPIQQGALSRFQQLSDRAGLSHLLRADWVSNACYRQGNYEYIFDVLFFPSFPSIRRAFDFVRLCPHSTDMKLMPYKKRSCRIVYLTMSVRCFSVHWSRQSIFSPDLEPALRTSINWKLWAYNRVCRCVRACVCVQVTHKCMSEHFMSIDQ